MTNLSRLVARHVSFERSCNIEKNVHEHGMDLPQVYLVNVFQNTDSLTHALHIFFGDFDEWCKLWHTSGLGR